MKIVFPNIVITPSNGSTGATPAVKPRVSIPHIVGTGANGIPVGFNAKPVVTGVNSIVSAVGSLTDPNGQNGRVWRLREAVDVAGNVAPGTPLISAAITDITPITFPEQRNTDVQFSPNVAFTSSKYYKLEIEDELEYSTYSTNTGGGGTPS